MTKMKPITLEQAQIIAALAKAANSAGTDAAAFASARAAMVTGVQNSQVHLDYIEGGCQNSVTVHSTLLGLLSVEAERARDNKQEA